MADEGTDILKLHFAIDIDDAEAMIQRVKDDLAGVVDFEKLQRNVQKASKYVAMATSKSSTPFTEFKRDLADIEGKLNSFNSMRSRIKRQVENEVKIGTSALTEAAQQLQTVVDLFARIKPPKLSALMEDFDARAQRGDYRGMFREFVDAWHQLSVFTTESKTTIGINALVQRVEDARKRIVDNWKGMKDALNGMGSSGYLDSSAKELFSKNLKYGLEAYSSMIKSATTPPGMKNIAGAGPIRNFLGQMVGDETLHEAVERDLTASATAIGRVVNAIGPLSQAIQSIPEDAGWTLAGLADGMSALTKVLAPGAMDVSGATVLTSLLNGLENSSAINGKAIADAVQRKLKSVAVPIALRIDPKSITPEMRESAQAELNSKPLTVPVELVFETGAKRVENAAKAAVNAQEKSLSFSAELEELKAYREYLNGTAIDAAEFRDRLNGVYDSLFPRRNRPSLSDNELIPHADKLIAEMETKAASLADAATKASARSALMIGGDAIEAFRADAQAKLDAMKPLEFTNIRLKASAVDVSTIKEALGIEALEDNAKLLKQVALKVSKLKLTGADKVDTSVLQKNIYALIDITLPISKVKFQDDVSKIKQGDLQRKIEQLGNDIVLPIYKADLGKVKFDQSGPSVSERISELANLVAYIQSIDLEKADIINGDAIQRKISSFISSLNIPAFDKLAGATEKIKFPFLEGDNLTRMERFANAIKEIAESMKYLEKLSEALAKLDVKQNDIARAMVRQTQARLKAEENANDANAKDVEAQSQQMLKDAETAAKAQISLSVNAEKTRDVFMSISGYMDPLVRAYNLEKASLGGILENPIVGGKSLKDTERLGDVLKDQQSLNEALRQGMGITQGLQDSLASYGGEFRDVNSRVREFTETFRQIRGGAMSDTLRKAVDEADRMTRAFGDSTKKFNELVRAVRSGRFDIQGGGAMSVAGLDVTKLKRLQAEMRTTGDAFTEMMRNMGFYVSGRTVISFFQNAVKSASAFAMEIRRIQSLATTFDFDRLKTGLESLDARFGNLIHNAKALYWAFSSGVRGTEEELVRFTETMSKTAITIGSDVMPVMDAATTLMNAYGKSAASAGEISDLLFTIVKEGKANGQQLAGSLGNIIAPASAMGLTFKDIGATISTLTRTMKTNNALTYLNNILSKMNNPTKEVQRQLDKLGLEINATAIKAKGFAQVMREIHDATRGDISVIAKLFPDIRGQRAAVTLFSTQFKEFERQLGKFDNMAGNMEEALDKITDNPEAQFAALRNGFDMIRQSAGDAAIQVITFGGAFTKVFSFVNGMKSFGRSVAGFIVDLAAVGVVMNMLGKAKLMFEMANVNAIQQMNLAYNEQTKLLADSVMSAREKAAADAAARVATLQRIHEEAIGNSEEYKLTKMAIDRLEVEEKSVKAKQTEAKLNLQNLKWSRDQLKNAEEMALQQQKMEMAFRRFQGSYETLKAKPEQWVMGDAVSKAGTLLRAYKKETALYAYESGLKTGDLQRVIDEAIARAIQEGQSAEGLKLDQAVIAARAGIAANDTVRQNLLTRMIADSKMAAMVAQMNADLTKARKEGGADVSGSLTTLITTLRSEAQNRAQVSRTAYVDLEKIYAASGMTDAEKKAMLPIMRELNELQSRRLELETRLYGVEIELGGSAFKAEMDGAKALANELIAHNKAHELNIQNIIKETEAKIKDAAATRDMAKAEAAAREGREKLLAYIRQNNLEIPGVTPRSGALDAQLAAVGAADARVKAANDEAEKAGRTAMNERTAADAAQRQADAVKRVADELERVSRLQDASLRKPGFSTQMVERVRLMEDISAARAKAEQSQFAAQQANEKYIKAELDYQAKLGAAEEERLRLARLRAEMNDREIIRQYAIQQGQYGGASNAWNGAMMAAQGTNIGMFGWLNKLAFIPGVGGAIGMFTRPISMFGKQIQWVTAMVTMANSKIAKEIIIRGANNKAIVSQIAANGKLTATQAMAAKSTTLYAGTLLNTPLFSQKGIVDAGVALNMRARDVQSALVGMGVAGGFAVAAIAGVVAILTSMTKNGGPLRKITDWIVGLQDIMRTSQAIEQKQDIFKEIKNARADFESRRQYLLDELEYREKTGQALNMMNAAERENIRKRAEQLRLLNLEDTLTSPHLENLQKEYEDVAQKQAAYQATLFAQQNDSYWSVVAKAFVMSGGKGSGGQLALQRDAEFSEQLKELQGQIEVERLKLQQLRPAMMAALRANEMILEIENSTNDVLMQEMTNAKRELALRMKHDMTFRRITILTRGESPYKRMLVLAKQEQSAVNAYQKAQYELLNMTERGVKEDDARYKEQQHLVETLKKTMEDARAESEKFNQSYVNYRKTLAQHIVERIKFDKEMAEMQRKASYMAKDRDALTGRGNIAEAEKLAQQMEDAHHLEAEALERYRKINYDAYNQQYEQLLKTVPNLQKEVTEKSNAATSAKEKLDNLPEAADEKEREKLRKQYAEASAEATGAAKALEQTRQMIQKLMKMRDDAKSMQLPEKELLEIRQKEMDAAKNLSSFWQKIVDDMTKIISQAKQNINDIQINRMREIIRGERYPGRYSFEERAKLGRDFMGELNKAIIGGAENGMGGTKEFNVIYDDLSLNGKEMSPDKRAEKLARLREIASDVTKNMDAYIDVQSELVKQQQEARKSTLQFAQSLMKFTTTAVDAVDATSSDAFSMRFRVFSGMLSMPEMRDATMEQAILDASKETRDKDRLDMEQAIADIAKDFGADAQKQYEASIKGMDTAANTFKSSVDKFDAAVKKPLVVEISSKDPFA